MPLYRDGKITLTKNSRSVIGHGTKFGTETMPGDVLILSEGEWVSHCYEIHSIESDTELTLDIEARDNVSEAEYVILRSVSTATNLYLMRKIDEFLKDRQVSLVEFREWMLGEPDGGPEGDGRYPLTDRFGVTVLVPCPNWLVTEYQESFDTLEDTIGALGNISQAVIDSQASAQSAAQSAADADTSAQASAQSASAAQSSETAAAQSAADADTSAQASAQSASDAASSAQSSSQSASAAQSSQQAAETSASSALASEQAASGHAQDAAQSAQEAEEAALGHMFEDGEVSESRGWTSGKITTGPLLQRQVIDKDTHIPTGYNALVFGDIILADGVTVIVEGTATLRGL